MPTSPQLKFVFTADITKAEKATNKLIGQFKRMSKEALTTAANMTFVTDAFKTIAINALQASRQTQEAFKKIRVGTGATGEALNGLLADFKKVNAQTSQSTEQVAAALADLNTRLGLTGEPLQKMTLAVAEASRMTGQEMSSLANEAAKAMNAMGISGDQGAAMIDRLFIASQNTNIGMSELATMTAKYSGVLQATGLSLDQSIAMLSSFSNAGLNVKNVMSGITAAMNKFAKAGVKDAGAELNKAIEAIRGAATESQAAKLAVETFGASGTAMAQAIRTGHFEVGELTEKLRNSQGAVEAASKETETFADSWARTQKNMVTALEPLGTALLSLGEKYIIPTVQWLGSFTAAGNETVVMLGVLAFASGPVIGNVAGLATALLTAYKGFNKAWTGLKTFYKGSILLEGVLNRYPSMIMLSEQAVVQYGNKILASATLTDKFKIAISGLGTACSKLVSWLIGPGGLVLGLSALAAYLVGDYIMSSRRAQQETAAFRAEIEKLAQSLAALSDRELSLKISDSQNQVQQLSVKIAERRKQLVKEDEGLYSKNSSLRGSTREFTLNNDEQLTEWKKQLKKAQAELVTSLNEEGSRRAQSHIAGIQQQFNDELFKAKSTEAARAIASKYVEQLGESAREYTADSKAGQAYSAAMKQFNSAAQTYRPVSTSASAYVSPGTKLAKTPKASAPKEDILERLRWQNSAGFLSDADYQAALASRFQSLTGGKGYETWSKDARSAYDELERLKKLQASKAAETLKWQNSAGFLGDDQYAASLEQRLASLTGGADFSKWSEEARGVFDELQRVMSEQLAPSLDSLKERFANGQITLGEYETQLESLKTKYQEYPAITKDLQKEMDAAKKSSQTFLSGMTAAIKDAKASFDNMSVTVGTGLADGFARAIAYGEDLGSTLQKLGQDIIYTVTKMLLLQSITRMFGGLFGGGSSNPLAVTMDGLDAVSGHASGDAFGPAGLVPFANGGIVGRPTLFKFAGGTGLMGEAGPEATMPLQRDSHGRLGVHASGGAGGVYAPQFNVTVNNNGGGDMSDEQAENMSRTLRDAIDARVAEDLYNYRRMGYYGGAFA